MDTKSYFKNLTRSVNYAVDDLLKAKYPATYNMKNVKKSISAGNKEVYVKYEKSLDEYVKFLYDLYMKNDCKDERILKSLNDLKIAL